MTTGSLDDATPALRKHPQRTVMNVITVMIETKSLI
jgi:hypothetical protein